VRPGTTIEVMPGTPISPDTCVTVVSIAISLGTTPRYCFGALVQLASLIRTPTGHEMPALTKTGWSTAHPQKSSGILLLCGVCATSGEGQQSKSVHKAAASAPWRCFLEVIFVDLVYVLLEMMEILKVCCVVDGN
jgi:hypothetical protein